MIFLLTVLPWFIEIHVTYFINIHLSGWGAICPFPPVWNAYMVTLSSSGSAKYVGRK